MKKKLKDFTKQDFLNHFGNIWEYEFKKTTKGNYERFDLQLNSDYVDTKSINDYLILYLDLLDNENFEMVSNIKVKEYTKQLKELIGA